MATDADVGAARVDSDARLGPTPREHVFASRILIIDSLKCLRRHNGGRSGRVRFTPAPRFLSSKC
jgi:hypothetical protein